MSVASVNILFQISIPTEKKNLHNFLTPKGFKWWRWIYRCLYNILCVPNEFPASIMEHKDAEQLNRPNVPCLSTISYYFFVIKESLDSQLVDCWEYNLLIW